MAGAPGGNLLLSASYIFYYLLSLYLSFLPLRQSGYLPSGRPRYSYTHLHRPPVLAITSPSHARPDTRVEYEDEQTFKFNGADIPFVSLNKEGLKRRVEETAEEGKSKNLGEVVELQPRDLSSLFARSARGASEEQRNSTSKWPMSRN